MDVVGGVCGVGGCAGACGEWGEGGEGGVGCVCMYVRVRGGGALMARLDGAIEWRDLRGVRGVRGSWWWEWVRVVGVGWRVGSGGGRGGADR